MPSSLVKRFRTESLEDDGRWQVRYQEKENYQRLVYVPLGIHMCGLRFVPEETWGDQSERAFAFEPQTGWSGKMPSVPDGPHFQAILAALTPKDLAPPD